ncbi:MAG: T9SS type A sorting domain-containing protein [Bacteroidetes bacterium]|nr:T9SS type A sorting domain-containing protein [Bacteroidota bacterium]
MKKLFTLLAVTAFTSFLGAQCTINSSVFSGPNDYGILPDTVTNLPVAFVGSPYTTDLQVHVDPDTVTALGTFPITQIVIDSVSGLPAGFTYLSNPVNGVMPGGSFGCVGVTGTATSGQELGGPASNGVYPIIVFFTATVNVLSVPTAFPATLTGYRIEIDAPNSLPVIESLRFAVNAPAPNPSDARTEFRFNAPVNGQVEFHLYNMLGAEVARQTIDAEKGSNRFTLETAALPAGVYMYSFRMGNSTVTRRLTISH